MKNTSRRMKIRTNEEFENLKRFKDYLMLFSNGRCYTHLCSQGNFTKTEGKKSYV